MTNVNQINVGVASKLARTGGIPLWPYLCNITYGGIITGTIILVTFGLRWLIFQLGFDIPFLTEISYWLALPVFGIYSIASLICLLIDAFRIVIYKIKNG